VANNPEAKPGQLARAFAIRAIAACRQSNDAEKAAAAFRAIGGHRALKNRVLKACAAAGVEINHR